MDKQLIKEVIKEMICDGEIVIKVKGYDGYRSPHRGIVNVDDIECIVGRIGFELEGKYLKMSVGG